MNKKKDTDTKAQHKITYNTMNNGKKRTGEDRDIQQNRAIERTLKKHCMKGKGKGITELDT